MGTPDASRIFYHIPGMAFFRYLAMLSAAGDGVVNVVDITGVGAGRSNGRLEICRIIPRNSYMSVLVLFTKTEKTGMLVDLNCNRSS
jgi:hypothetical protein